MPAHMKLDKKVIQDILALTPMQEGMLFYYLKEPGSSLFVEQVGLTLSGTVELSAFMDAWQWVTDGNEMLRTVFRWEYIQQPVQVILKKQELQFDYMDLTSFPPVQRRDRLEEIREAGRAKGFDLHRVPFRVTLCKLEDSLFEMVLCHHHILYDGWSNGVLLGEFFRTYDRLLEGLEPEPLKKTGFKEYLQFLRERDLGGEELYWKELAGGFVFPPAVWERPEAREYFRTSSYRVAFPAGLKERLEGFAAEHKLTLPALLYGAWGLLLGEYNEDPAVVFDTAVSGRPARLKGIEDMVGLFTNTLPLPLRPAPGESLPAFLERVSTLLREREPVETSSIGVIRKYFPPAAPGLLDTLAVVENYPLDRRLKDGGNRLEVTSFTFAGAGKYDLTLIFTLWDSFYIDFNYSPLLLGESCLQVFFRHFVRVLETCLGDPSREAVSLRVVSPKEKRLLKRVFRDKQRKLNGGSDTAGGPGKGDGNGYQKGEEYVPPRDAVESKLADTWREILGTAGGEKLIGIDDDFFRLGGHSLKAARLANRVFAAFRVKLPLAEVFRLSTIRRLAEYIKNPARVGGGLSRVEPVEQREYYPLASAQKRLYMLRQMEPDSIAYNGPTFLILEGIIDGARRGRLEEVFRRLIRRHEILRTAFPEVRGCPVQRVYEEVPFSIRYRDLEEGDDGGEEKVVGDGLQGAVSGFARPFVLSQPPLLRVELARVGEAAHLLMVDMHHIVTDGTSQAIFIRELSALDRGEKLPPLQWRYKDFALWQQRRLGAGELDGAERYWLEVFSGDLPVLNLPADFSRPREQSFEGSHIYFSPDREICGGLEGPARETGGTLFTLLSALYGVLMYKYTGQEDMVVGTALAGRGHGNLEGMMGLLMETAALRLFPRAGETLREYLEQVKKQVLQMLRYQDYPFRELMKQVADESDRSRNPLFDTMFILQNTEQPDLVLEGLTVTPYTYETGVAKVDLTLEAMEKAGGIEFKLEYCTALFKDESMERFSAHWLNLLRSVASGPQALDCRVGELDIMTPEEKQQLLVSFQPGSAGFAPDRPVTLLLEEQAARAPHRVALCHRDQVLTYGQFYRRSLWLGGYLREKGLTAGMVAALQIEPSLEMVIGLWGILYAGGIYLPIPPDSPEERVDFVLSDANARLLINHETPTAPRRITDYSNGGKVGELDVDQLAYIIYTSGSTGRPKGVGITHRNLSAYLFSFGQEFFLTEEDVVIQQASYAFDAFVEEMYPILLKGGRMVVMPRGEIRDISLLHRAILRYRGTMIDGSPLLLDQLNRREPLPTMRIYISGGDVLKPSYVTRLTGRGMVYNTYGPTETTVCATYYRCTGEETHGVPIGRPIANYGVYLLDCQQQLVPIGVVGEICISGPGVAAGYMNRPELTAERFITYEAAFDEKGDRQEIVTPSRGSRGSLPLALPAQGPPEGSRRAAGGTSLSRFYRSGDLGRWLPDGSIEFMGRLDYQVKIRGYRIELGEIEGCLEQHEAVRGAAVIDREDGDKRKYLCAYVVVEPSMSMDVPELRAHLARKLPDYMVPAWFVPVQEIPRTPGGKVRRRGLPEPDRRAAAVTAPYTAPSTVLEKEIAAIWEQVLSLEKPGIHDNFFDLGGDSISANQALARIREQFDVDLPLKDFFQNPFISSLAAEVQQREKHRVEIRPCPRDGRIPLSFAQERLWFLQRLDAGNTAYFVPRVVRMKGQLEKSLLEKTFTEIIRRHEILRTVFPEVDGQPVQQIGPPFPFTIPLLDWSGLAAGEQERRIHEFLEEEGRKPFDFVHGPLLRVTLLKLAPQEHLFVLTEHHLIHDGWTQGVLLGEIIECFGAFSQGLPSPLPPLPIQYADFVIWQRRYLQGARLQRHLDYWKQKLGGMPPVLDLPGDRPRPAVISGEGGLRNFHLSPELSSALAEYSRQRGATLFMAMLTAFKVFLYRYTGVEDLCVGTGIANRGYKELEGMLGMVINTLALRTSIRGGASFSDCLRAVRTTCLEAYEHEDTPFGKVVEVLKPERSLRYTPIFQVMFSFMDTPGEALQLPGLELELLDTHNRSSKSDINIVVVPPREDGEGAEQRILVEWEYNSDIFDAATVERMVEHYTRLLETAVFQSEPGTGASPGVGEMPMLSEAETRDLVYRFNRTGDDSTGKKALHVIFEEHAAQWPDRIALIGPRLGETGPLTLSYGELDRRAGQLARLLRQKGAVPGAIAGLMVERSVRLMVGLLGILKSGAAYMPIDPAYPQARIDYMLADSNACILLTSQERMTDCTDRSVTCPNGNLPPGIEIIDIEGKPAADYPQKNTSAGNAGDMAYVIYTSGTTGRPKGVLTTHGNVERVVRGTRYADIRPADRLLQLSNAAFDGSTFDIFGAFLNGAGLVLIQKEEALDAARLAGMILRQGIDLFFVTVSLFNTLVELEPDCLKGLRYILFGGDNASPGHVRKAFGLMGAGKVINVYGPTESTVFATAFRVDREPPEDAPVPIGLPLPNTSVYILDGRMNPVPFNVSGRLYIGGRGNARGYVNRPQLTHEKFIPNPFAEGGRLYDTGDIACRLPDGNVLFRGRSDQQVKIRGFRIEPLEIESRLTGHQAVAEAVVMVRERGDNDKYLCAYAVPAAGEKTAVTPDDLRSYLSALVPDYMVPAHITLLERIPLTPNGKVDRGALPAPETEIHDGYTAPQDAVEQRLVELWSEVLQLEAETRAPGIDDDFFRCGGHSLKATLLVAYMHKEWGVRISLKDFFQSPTVRGLAVLIRGGGEVSGPGVLPVEEREYYPLAPAQKRLYILQQVDAGFTGYNVPVVLEIEGDLLPERVEAVFNRLIRRHEGLRTSFFILGEEPVQRIHKDVHFQLEYPSSPLASAFIQPFDLTRAPLLRVGIVRLEEHKHVFLMDMHHIITDGTSMGILVREFINLYREEGLPELSVGYRDYALARVRGRESEAFGRREQWWLHRFAGEVPAIKPPLDFPRPPVRRFEGGVVSFRLDAAASDTLRELALENGASLFMVLLEAYALLLARLSAAEELVVGIPVAGRGSAELQGVVGMFINTLALRLYPRGERGAADFLRELKHTTLEAFENQDYPFEDLVEKIGVERDPARNPLFDVFFTLQNMDIRPVELPGMTVTPRGLETSAAKFDLALEAEETAEGLRFRFIYAEALFKPETIERFSRYYREILRQIPGSPDRKLGDIDFLPREEKQMLLEEFNRTQMEVPAETTIQRMFQQQAARTPDYTALVVPHSGAAVTYGQLDYRARALARVLEQKGAGPGSIVAVMADRSIPMIIGLLAILGAGGAYLPIDPGVPDERIRYMLADSNARILLTGQEHITDCTDRFVTSPNGNLTPGNEIIDIEGSTAAGLPPENTSAGDGGEVAYVIYTSGSTGLPKGVVVPHRGLVNLVYAYREVFGLTHNDRHSQTASAHFDAMGPEIWPALVTGASVYFVDEDTRMDPPAMKQWLLRRRITMTFQPTMMAEYLLQREWPLENTALRVMQAAGDRLTRYPVGEYPFRFYNLYGPTESTVWTTWAEVPPHGGPGAPPIGQPIANHQVYILDNYFNPVPVGVPGQLCIAGPGVAAGYLNRPELTAEKFVGLEGRGERGEGRKNKNKDKNGQNTIAGAIAPAWAEGPASLPSPLSPLPSRLYKTGDSARWLKHGVIQFLGRIDRQVKIRGFRIELGEIEGRLLNHDGVGEAVVIDTETRPGDRALCAYIVPARPAPQESALTDYLSHHLPHYMVPSSFVILDRIPLTPSGKIDRKALPLPGPAAGDGVVTPRDTLEEQLALLWKEVLHQEPSAPADIDANFFRAGGHSLKAHVLTAKIRETLDVDVPLPEMFRSPSIRRLAAFIRTAAPTRFETVRAAEKRRFYPLSPAQKRLFILQQMEAGFTGYNVPVVMEVKGPLDPDRVERVFRQLIQRHESLRTSFYMLEGQPVQRIAEEVTFTVEKNFPPSLSAPETAARFIRPFDFARAPLLRVGIARRDAENSLFLLDMHHIVTDGASMNILVNQFTRLYHGETLEPPVLQYRDYALWQDRRSGTPGFARQEAWWLGQFGGEIPMLELPLDYPRPQVRDFSGGSVTFEIGGPVGAALRQTALDNGVSLFMVLMAAYTLVLSRLGGVQDLVVGVPAAGRGGGELRDVIGMFVNTLPLRTRLDGRDTPRNHLDAIRNTSLQAFENQDYPFQMLVDRLDTRRDASRNPLFDTLFALQNIEMSTLSFPGLTFTPRPPGRISAPFDLSLEALEAGDVIRFKCLYASALFQAETIRRWMDHMTTVLKGFPISLDLPLKDIQLLSHRERREILVDFNRTQNHFPLDTTLHRMFEAQAARTPDHAALVVPHTGGAVTYAQLNRRAQDLARLLEEKSAGPGAIVAVMADRTDRMAAGLLAVLFSGAAYLPIDPTVPGERIRYMLADSNARIIITTQERMTDCTDRGSFVTCPGEYLPPGIEILDIESQQAAERPPGNTSVVDGVSDWDRLQTNLCPYEQESAGGSGNVAYVIYTSGSTGLPKGVAVRHRGVVNLVYAYREVFRLTAEDRHSQTASAAFDAMGPEIWPALVTGASVYFVDEDTRVDPPAMKQWLLRRRITMTFQPTIMAESLLQLEWPLQNTPLRVLQTAGDRLTRYPAGEYPFRFYNLYGPTESTVWSTWTEVAPRGGDGAPPIGKPIANHRVYILDNDFNAVPIGVPGQLCIAGEGVAAGYLNRPELTAEKFVGGEGRGERGEGRKNKNKDKYKNKDKNGQNTIAGAIAPAWAVGPSSLPSPLSPLPSRFYLTGDSVRWLPNGVIQFLGRIDHQVKIRGFRIELGEIEHRLLKHDRVAEAAVITRQTGAGESFLCAYAVPTGAVDREELAAYLAGFLPAYMVPTAWVFLDNLPLNPSGKLDRKALPAPETRAAGENTAPRDRVERELARAWAKILELEPEQAGIDDDFFSMGGHSLKATALIAEIHAQLGVKIPLAEVFNRSTIRGLAQYIDRLEQGPAAHPVQPLETREYYEPSYHQKRLWILYQANPDDTSYHMGDAMPLEGPVDEKTVKAALEAVVKRHESFRTGFREVGGRPVQFIRPTVDIPLLPLDLSHLQPREQEDRLQALAADIFQRPFDLSQPPLFRTALVKQGENRHTLMVNMHHIISDHWSQGILKEDFTRFYQALKQGLPVEEKIPSRQYKEIAHHRNLMIRDENVREPGRRFWKEVFCNDLPSLQLPYDFEHGPPYAPGATVSLPVEPGLEQRVETAARENRTTPFMILFALYNWFLFQLTGQEEFVTSLISAGRDHVDAHDIVGFFVNSLPLHCRVDPEESFTGFLRRLEGLVREAQRHQDYPPELVLDELGMAYPHIAASFNMLNADTAPRPPGAAQSPARHGPARVKFPLALHVLHAGDQLRLDWVYQETLFLPETAAYIAENYLAFLEDVLDGVVEAEA